jgi:hypothetical protein
MAKDLPYFKFTVSEYINGNITLEDFYTQGVFINVCAFYWFKSGKVTLSEIKRRLSKAKPKSFDTLIENNLIKIEGDNIRITFLDEQLNERGHVSVTNSENGKLGGRGNKKSENKATALENESEPIPKKSNIEERREEEKKKREEENREEGAADAVCVWPTFEDFWELYDKKEDKPKCLLKWKKINQEAREKIMEHLALYVLSTPDKQFRKHPKTYLENQSWNNEIIIPIPNGTTDKRQQGIRSLKEAFANEIIGGNS